MISMGGAADTVALRPLNGGGVASKPQAHAAPSSAGSAGWRIIKFFGALLLIPACVGFTLAVNEQFLSTWPRINFAVYGPGVMLKYFCSGIFAFACLAVLLWRPVTLYVFGHELVHALATWLCLGKVTNLVASARGGQVTSSKSNTFIRLAPYCVPVYALLAVGLYAALNYFWRDLSPQAHWLAFALGSLYAFHVGFSLWSLRRDQPDFRQDGWLFSLVTIYLVNLLVFVLLLGFILGGSADEACGRLKATAHAGWQHTSQIYRNLGSTCEQILRQ